MRNTLKTIAIALMIAVIYSSTISAASSYTYSLQAIPLSTSVSAYITADSDFPFVVNQIYSSEGNVKVRSAIQTYYNGSYVTIGDYFADDEGDVAKNSYYPKNNRNWPSGTTSYKQCSGSGVTDNYCVIQNSRYRVIYNNKNVFNTLERVNGKFYFSN